MPFPPDDRFHFNASQGYLELGMLEDAEAELEKISPEFRSRPELLMARVAIFQAAGRWTAMQSAARKLVELQPDDPQWPIAWAYATRRAESIELARIILATALERHPLTALIHYNLACYDCVMDDPTSSQEFLERALQLEPAMRAMALEDPDLKTLRAWIATGLSASTPGPEE